MSTRFILIPLLTIVIYSCKISKSSGSQKNKLSQIEFSDQNFDKDLFKGKWFTNSKYDKSNYAIFQENNHVIYDDKRNVPYKLKKDSIFIYFSNYTAKGRLINLDENQVDIIWQTKGSKERIKYYRP